MSIIHRLFEGAAAERSRRRVPAATRPTRSALDTAHVVTSLIVDAAHASPNSVALRAGPNRMTYGDLLQAADRLAADLQVAGAAANVPVGICMARSFDQIVAVLAVLRAGGAFLPIDPEWPEDRIRLVLDDAGAPIVVASSAAAAKCRAGGRTVLDGRQDNRDRANLLRPAAVGSADLAYVIYTSGSTGEPKGVEITHGNLINLVAWHRRAFSITPRDQASCLAGLSFDALVWELLPYLATGATLHLPPEQARTSAVHLQQWLRREAITIAFVPTPLAETMIAADWPQGTALRTLLTGGDTLHVRPRPGLPFSVVNNYGPTECTVVTTSGVVAPEPAAARLPTIGRPISGTTVHILDEVGEPVEPGEIGEICISGENVGRGYRNRPALTAEKFLPGNARPKTRADRLFRTGDLGAWTRDGEIAFHGRCDDQVKLRGHRIEPDEISAVLDHHPSIAQSAIVARGEGLEKRLVAYVVPADQQAPRAAELHDFLGRRLPTYMLPATFVRVASLPLTANGKVDRPALPEPASANTLQASVYRAPTTHVEGRIVSIIEHLLQIDRVGVDDNFFLLGGHSLLGTQLVARIREAFGAELGLRDLFDAQTAANLARRIEQEVRSMVASMSEDDVRRMTRPGG